MPKKALVTGLPSDRFITDDQEGKRNARSWTLFFNQIFLLVKGQTTTAYGNYFAMNLEVNGLPAMNFANDAAAAIGGVPIGGLYHNAGVVRVRLV